MEKFKVIEKEMKTKAFSKEGLMAASKLDPKEREKVEISQFLSSSVDELDRQIEVAEAEVDSILATQKKGKKESGKNERIAEIETMIERHKWHQSRLELILRAIENGNVAVEDVANIKEDIKYYIESNQDPDFGEDDTLYEGLNLGEEDGPNGLGQEADSQDTEESIVKEESTPVTKTISREAPPEDRRSLSISTSPKPTITALANSLSAMISAPPKPATITPKQMEPLKYASAAAAAGSAAAPHATGSSLSAATMASIGIAPLPPPVSSIAIAHQGINGPSRTSSTGSAGLDRSSTPVINDGINLRRGSGASAASIQAKADQSSGKSLLTALQQADNISKGFNDMSLDQRPDVGKYTTDDTSMTKKLWTEALPLALQDIGPPLEAARNRMSQPPDAEAIQVYLENAIPYMPKARDGEKSTNYAPKQPCETPSYYPQVPLPILETPSTLKRMELDTLFFIFYYQQGTYAQYLGAKELKEKSWRFHKRYITWFQRHEQPKEITEEYELGCYRYFDFEGNHTQFGPDWLG